MVKGFDWLPSCTPLNLLESEDLEPQPHHNSDAEDKISKPGMYQYTPLATTDSIRLILLQPGAQGSDIHCGLIHATLSELRDDIYQHYTALSYVWGDESKMREVFVDHKPFQATTNLAAALHDLRHPQNVLRLWADAICIDQSSILERNHQVGLMREIYSLAQHTVIHLGGTNEECDEVLNTALQGKFDSRLMKLAVDQILSRPWFKRVWIYQELVLSKDPWVQCGRTRIRWDVLYAAFVTDEEVSGREGSKSPTKSLNLVSPHQTRPFEVFCGMHAARKDEPPTLLSVMVSRRGFGASNPRDLVYGHLAVARLPSKNNVPPCPVVDYKRSVIEIFTEATTYMLALDMQPLAHIDVRSPSQPLKALPTWVPNWSLPVSECLDPFPRYSSTFFELWGDDWRSFKAEFPSPTICSLGCIKIGTVVSVSTVAISRQLSTSGLTYNHAWETRARDFRKAHPRWVAAPPPDASDMSQYRAVYQSIGHLFAPITLPALPGKDEDLRLHFQRLDLYTRAYEVTKTRNLLTVESVLMDRAFGSDAHGWLAGRRIASFSTNILSIVPPGTRPGDEIHECNGKGGFQLVVLRPHCITEAAPNDLEIATEQVDTDDWGEVRHFTLVGCAWIGDCADKTNDTIMREAVSGTAWIH